MQLSKLTFSLASLVLLMAFGLVFGTMPIMADDGAGGTIDDPHGQDGHATGRANDDETGNPTHMHPTVAITLMDADTGMMGDQDYGNKILEDVPFKVKFTFSAPVENFSTVTVLDGDANGADVDAVVFTSLTVTAVTPTDGTASTTEYTADITLADRDTDPAATPATHTTVTRLFVQVASDAATGIGRVPFTLTGGQGNLRATDLELTVTKMPPMMDDGPATAGKVTGTVSLTDPFPITITFATAIDLMEGDISVEGGGVLVENSLYDDSPDDKPMTVWKATVQPYPNAVQAFGTITVTLTTGTDTNVMPDATEGMITNPDATLLSITPSDGADDTAMFMVTLTFDQSVMALAATDLMVTPAAISITDDNIAVVHSRTINSGKSKSHPLRVWIP